MFHGSAPVVSVRATAARKRVGRGSLMAITLTVLAAARGDLESQGIEFHRDTLDSGVCHQAFFSDPDGNPLILHHRYAPKGEAPPAAS